MPRGQASTEYLIILAVVIVISLVVVGVLGGFIQIGGGLRERRTRAYWRSEQVGVLDWLVKENGAVTLALVNNADTPIKVTDIKFDGQSIGTDPFTLKMGEEKSVSGTTTGGTGEYSKKIVIEYERVKYGLPVSFAGKEAISGTYGEPPPKSSCPFIYSYDGIGYHLDYEAFSQAVVSSQEYTSYGLLPSLKPSNGKLFLKVTEERPEVAFIDGIQLWAVDHDGGDIMPDTHGRVHTIKNRTAPYAVYDKKGTLVDLEAKPFKTDFSEFTVPASGEVSDWLVLEFPKPADAARVNVIIDSKLTAFLEYEWNKTASRWGANNFPLVEKMLSTVHKGAFDSMIKREILLKLQVYENGRWTTREYLKPHGLFIPLLADINVSGVSGEKLSVRLKFPPGVYEIKSVYADYTPAGEVRVTKLTPYNASKNNLENILSEVSVLGDKHRVRLDKGDEATLTFKDPAATTDGFERDYIVAARGYYNHLISENRSKTELARNYFTRDLPALYKKGFIHRNMMREYLREHGKTDRIVSGNYTLAEQVA